MSTNTNNPRPASAPPQFPPLSEQKRVERLQPPRGRVTIVLDTDTYNEVDDQFALAHATLSPDKINLAAVYAAPFHNARSNGPADGMERSYAEIQRVLNLLPAAAKQPPPVYRGSTAYLADERTPQESAAARDLVARAQAAHAAGEVLYVVAIGAITNVASALLMHPQIIEDIVIVWLGGHSLMHPHTREFNLQQDVAAARVVFGCGAPVVQIPCAGVTTHLATTIAELEYYLRGKSRIADYLTDIVVGYADQPYAWSKVIWDITTIAWLLNADWIPSVLVHSPIVTYDVTWSFDQSRHLIRSATAVDRDRIFGDLFRKLAAADD